MEEKKNKPWERQEGESEKAFEAFAIYRDMPTNGENRSIRAVGQKLGKSRAIIERWSASNNWQERVKAYDADLEKQYHAKRKKLIADTKDRQLKISYSLEKKALEALNLLEPSEMTPRDIKEMLRLAMEIQGRNLIDEPAVEDQQQQSTLAESIISAYEKRMEGGDT
ncbi:MAG: hypothetical protein LIO54_09415 [Oscillospiraceae bacterium]|nr:hypothetical protein [Oscillospiraceae bacterium]